MPISYFQAAILGLPPGCVRAVPGLEPRPQRHPPVAARLEHPPERLVLPDVPRRDASRHRDRAVRLLPAATGSGSCAGIGRSLRDREIAPDDADAKLGWLLVVGTIPAGILGLALEHKLRAVFASPQSASIFLCLNGLLLYGAELLRRRAPSTETDDDTRIARQVSWRDSALVGSAQALALIPGFSRSGATMARRTARRAVAQGRGPVRVPAGDADHRRGGGAEAARSWRARRATASAARRSSARSARRSRRGLSVKFLMRYFETNTLMPFAIYCFVAGGAAALYFALT